MQKLKLGWLDDWITFPIYDENGHLIGATARAGETNKSTAKYCNVPDMSPNLLYIPDWKMVKLQDKIYLTFGIIDAVTLTQLGYAGISTTTGKRLDHTSLDFLRKRIIIIPDRGEEREAIMLASKLGWRGSVARIDWPDNCKDINDLHTKDGVEKWLSP
jgi:DNA primase